MKIYQCEEGEEEVGFHHLFREILYYSKLLAGEEKDEGGELAGRGVEDAQEEEPQAGEEGSHDQEEGGGGERVHHPAGTFYSW